MSAANATHAGELVDCRTARLTTRWLDDDTAVVGASGEIDAANADGLGSYLLGVAQRGKCLILDLTDLGFIGVQGFSVISQSMADAGIGWAVVPGPAAARVLRVCDRDGVLVTSNSVEAAAAALRSGRRPPLQLVCR